MEEFRDVLIYGVLLFGGLIGGALYGKSTRKFLWSEYAVLAMLPSISVLWAYGMYGPITFYVYIIACVVGTSAEYMVGWAYHVSMSRKLWVYKRLSIHDYTSILSVPFWGIAGVSFLVVSRFLTAFLG
jgi:hypothetical protein